MRQKGLLVPAVTNVAEKSVKRNILSLATKMRPCLNLRGGRSKKPYVAVCCESWTLLDEPEGLSKRAAWSAIKSPGHGPRRPLTGRRMGALAKTLAATMVAVALGGSYAQGKDERVRHPTVEELDELLEDHAQRETDEKISELLRDNGGNPMHWTHPVASAEQFESDIAVCEQVWRTFSAHKPEWNG